MLRTLHDAGHYVAALPKAAQDRVEWQTAAEMLILAAKGQRPLMFAQIAMLRGLHAGDDAPAPKLRCIAPRRYRIVRRSTKTSPPSWLGIPWG
jgi:hypothetical protein